MLNKTNYLLLFCPSQQTESGAFKGAQTCEQCAKLAAYLAVSCKTIE